MPILVVHADDDLEHAFISEILKAEGLFFFESARIEDCDADRLRDSDLVVALHGDYSREGADRLLHVVRDGGKMIAIRPCGALADMLGITRRLVANTQKPDPTKSSESGATNGLDGFEPVNNARVQISPSASLPTCPEPLLCPGPSSDSFECDGDVAARLIDELGKDCGPAIVRKRIGKGSSTILAYDVVGAVLRLRHGNWDLSERADMLPLRGPRHIYGLAGVAEKHSRQYPLGDIHQDVFRELILQLLNWDIVPRLWHLPDAQPVMAFIKSDGCGEEGAPLGIELSERYGHKHNFFRAPVSRYEGSLIREWHERGHFMSLEFNINPVTYDRPLEDFDDTDHHQIQDLIDEQSQRFTRETGLEIDDVVIHSCQWSGPRTSAILEEMGWRMPFHFCGHDPRMSKHNFGPFSVASAMPMRYFDNMEGLLDLFLQNCTVDDSQSVTGPDVGTLGLSQYEYAEATTKWVIESRDHWHVPHIGTYHPCYLIRPKDDPRRTFEAANMFYAAMSSLGIELGNLGEWSKFVQSRDKICVELLEADRGKTVLRLTASRPVKGLTLIGEADRLLSKVLVDGRERPIQTMEIEGRRRSAVVLNLDVNQTSEVVMTL